MERERRHLEFGRFRLDLANHLLLRDGEPVPLTPKAFDTLVALAERPGEVLSKQALLERVWPDTAVEEGNLTQNVYTLRKALAAAGSDRRYIETVPRRGYRFVGPVKQVGQRTTSIAVLPFIPLDAAAEDRYLGLGMADALITRLSNLRQLNMRPTGAVRGYADPARDPVTAGRELRVDAVVDGTLQRSGDRLRVSVQLVDVEDRAPHWAAQFEAYAAGIFEMQDSISRQVAEELRLELSRHERERLSARGPVDPDAYHAYIRGRYFWNRRSREGLLKALDCFREAIARDPGYAQAFAGLADTCVLLPLYAGVPTREAFPQAKDAALEALRLDPGLAEAHTSLAYVRFFFDWDWDAAGEGFRQALALNPGYATAHHWYSYFLTAMGRHGEAARSARRALELDPLSLVINTDLGMVLYFARRGDEAIAQLTATLELDPAFAYAHFGLGHAFQAAGRSEQAVASFRRAAELSGRSVAMAAALGQALAVAGHEEEARAILAEIEARAAKEYVEASHFAFLHAGLGERRRALEWLHAACEERSRFVVLLDVWPLYDPLRGAPGWNELLARVGLPGR